ncbi:hypothetical protein [uncultured Sulfitobacter sp.]|uniref:hypothetical protein n=1 Tax=uncultured Sulfitobacter sp. TaxID=191468 RepID=UPI00261F95A9|nr:hypothetical protein [uncultured Sulfitobacter sp.]
MIRTAVTAAALTVALALPASAQSIDRTALVFRDNGIMEKAVGFCYDTIARRTAPDRAAKRAGFSRSTDRMLKSRFDSRRKRDKSFGHYRAHWVNRGMPDDQQARMVPVDPSIDVNTNSIKCEITIMGINPRDEAKLLPTALAYLKAFDKTLVLARPFSKIDKSQFSTARTYWHGGLYFQSDKISGGVSYTGTAKSKPTGTFEIELVSRTRLNQKYGG